MLSNPPAPRSLAALASLAAAFLSFALPADAARSGAAACADPKSAPKPAVKRPKFDSAGEREEIRAAKLGWPTGRIPGRDWKADAARQAAHGVPELSPAATLERGAVPGPVRGREGFAWKAIGPAPLDSQGTSRGYAYGTVGGRTNAIAFADATTAYAGFPSGGLWKTSNCCSEETRWESLFENLPVQSVGAITIDPQDSSVIFVGSGDSQLPHYDMYGNGIWRSTDAGRSWEHFGADVFSPFSLPGAPGAECCALATDENVKVIAIDPNDPSTILAGASFGLFVSRDRGETWERIDVVDRNAEPWRDDAQRVSGLLIDGSTNPSTVWVALGYPYANIRPARAGLAGGANGIYIGTLPRSAAPSFTASTAGWPAGTASGTPNDVGRIELAGSADFSHVWALVGNYGATTADAVGQSFGLFLTTDRGVTWTKIPGASDGDYRDCGNSAVRSNQDWYDLSLTVDPADPKHLFIGRTDAFEGTLESNGRMTIRNLSNVYSPGCASYGSIHPDIHAIATIPGTSPTRILIGSDGGMHTTSADGTGHVPVNGDGGPGSLGTIQFYAGQLGADFATNPLAFGGMQDNGNASWSAGESGLLWKARGIGGDGFWVSFDPTKGQAAGRWCLEYTFGEVYCSTAGAAGNYSPSAPAYSSPDQRGFGTPFLLDTRNCGSTCSNLVLGSSRVWASANASGKPVWVATGSQDMTKRTGNRYTNVISSLALAPGRPGAVLAGTLDGNVWWAPDVFTGAGCNAASANTAAFACTANPSAGWVDVTGGNAELPNRSVNGLAFAPDDHLTFYAALDGFDENTPGQPGHVFRGRCSADPCSAGNLTWENVSGNLPDLPADSILVDQARPSRVFLGSELGFFWTDDVAADSPIWYRWNDGMPATKIVSLVVDRGPADAPTESTTLGAFTYGRGAYVLPLGWPKWVERADRTHPD